MGSKMNLWKRYIGSVRGFRECLTPKGLGMDMGPGKGRYNKESIVYCVWGSLTLVIQRDAREIMS